MLLGFTSREMAPMMMIETKDIKKRKNEEREREIERVWYSKRNRGGEKYL